MSHTGNHRTSKNASLWRSGIRYGVAAAVLVCAALPAVAQWTPVAEVPAGSVYSVRIQDNTILATADSVVYISTDGGTNDRVPC